MNPSCDPKNDTMIDNWGTAIRETGTFHWRPHPREKTDGEGLYIQHSKSIRIIRTHNVLRRNRTIAGPFPTLEAAKTAYRIILSANFNI